MGENHDEDYGQYYEVEFNMELITGFNIFVLAYAYQVNLFPTYNSLGSNKSVRTGMKAVGIASLLSFVIYMSIGVITVYMFGTSLTSSVIDNVNKEKNIYSYVVRI